MGEEASYVPRIALVVLAAGQSSRMGTHKLLLPLGPRPVVAHVVAAAEECSADEVVVVLGHDAKRVRSVIDGHRGLVIRNHLYDDGMASSLRTGLAAAESEAKYALAGILVALGDQPLVSAAHLDRMLAAARAEPDAIIAATYAGTRATPVYLPSAYFDEVYQLEGDEGGRNILKRHPERVRMVPLDPDEVGLDCDTPEDYQRIQQAYAQWHGGDMTGGSSTT